MDIIFRNCVKEKINVGLPCWLVIPVFQPATGSLCSRWSGRWAAIMEFSYGKLFARTFMLWNARERYPGCISVINKWIGTGRLFLSTLYRKKRSNPAGSKKSAEGGWFGDQNASGAPSQISCTRRVVDKMHAPHVWIDANGTSTGAPRDK